MVLVAVQPVRADGGLEFCSVLCLTVLVMHFPKYIKNLIEVFDTWHRLTEVRRKGNECGGEEDWMKEDEKVRQRTYMHSP